MIEQGTPEWLAARCGKVTASRVADVIAKTKSGYSTSRANYLAQLVAERLTGTVAETFTNLAMAHGTATEPEARAAYAFLHNTDVAQVGFVDHPEIPTCGASPDGLVGTDGLVEIKCPNTATHIATLLGGTVPKAYVTQMLWQMECTGRKWCDFVSYDPRLPERMQLWVQRVAFDPDAVKAMRSEVVSFLDELRDTLDALEARYPDPLQEAAE